MAVTDVIYTGQSSADCVKSFFDLHIGYGVAVLDLTYGNGTFWDWPRDELVAPDWSLTVNEKNRTFHGDGTHEPLPAGEDFRATRWCSRSFDVVVFDPPFTANGPSKDGHQKRYGADRSQEGAPQNIHEVRALLAGGLVEAMRLSRKWVLLKTQDVVESGKLHDSEGLARMLFMAFGFRIVDYRLYDAQRRAQPDEARGATVKHFRNRPSIFMLAKRGSS